MISEIVNDLARFLSFLLHAGRKSHPDRRSVSLAARIGWIDFARGLAIILIVMHHSRDYVLALLPPLPSDVIRWAYIDPFLVHVRLPLFFTLSGFLAFGASASASGDLKFRRMASLAAIYGGWSVIMLAVIPSWPNTRWHLADADAYLGLLHGASVLWYLWALILAFLFTALTRDLRSAPALLVACVLGGYISHYGQQHLGAWASLGRYLPLYVAGARLGPLLLRLAQWRNVTWIGLVTDAYLIVLDPRISFSGIDLVRNGLGAALGIVASSWLAERSPKVASRIAWLGKRTLSIYVLHFPVVALLGCAILQIDLAGLRPLALLLALPGLTLVTILSTLCLMALIDRIGLAWTLAMPRRAALRNLMIPTVAMADAVVDEP